MMSSLNENVIAFESHLIIAGPRPREMPLWGQVDWRQGGGPWYQFL